MISLLIFIFIFVFVSFGSLVSNASGNGVEAVLLALSIFSIVFRIVLGGPMSTRIGVCFVTCPTYEAGILQLKG